MERKPDSGHLHIQPVARHIFRRAGDRKPDTDTRDVVRTGVLGELERYPELRH